MDELLIAVSTVSGWSLKEHARILELEELARAAHAARDLVELRHRTVLVVVPLDREHRRAHARQVIGTDVPALEVGSSHTSAQP